MKNKPKIDPGKLAEFYAEVDKPGTKPGESAPDSAAENSSPRPLPYLCPNCRKPLGNRKEPCPHCGYHGYIPMAEGETRRVRWILFFLLLVLALVVYFLL